jgi:acyl carrier protein
MSQDTEQRIREIIAKHRPPEAGPMPPGATLKDAGIDSLNAIEILFEVEEAFGVNLPDRDPNFDTGTLQGLVEAVEGALALKAAAIAPGPAPG